MKKITLLLLVFLTTTITFSQKKEKIKGSRVITHTIKEVESFENIEVEDNVEIFLVKADTSSIEIEADDNLHDVIDFSVVANTLRITTLKNVSSSKKFSIRVNYAADLKQITAKNEARINALNELQLENVIVKNYDNSASFLNVNSTTFTLILNDKSEAEINVKAENTTLELSKNADLKALIASPEVKLDMYEKAKAKIEGDVSNLKIRLDNNAYLTANKFPAKSIELAIEGYAKCLINAVNDISISASGKTTIELLGEPKIDMKQFTNSATLYKKEN
ncbi:hypothetical protein SY27_15235 [Flavobacterium sp. 316]|uniref:DUF2807 domain-containing protein n=1 Tax=Flavobacterium sediminilitoris TaxID=2024526 RepID=A0ABY4HMI5_9FLAO|nr:MULTISPECIES: DUF2807 domain-containing protein [Flavobacterium]KIX19885.1 hypothetical protein SY27_15235 [Flavobacterium sp. 316]UOX33895.1 DUF2807 domain-containing protein [Flavobacterium sediminilitoris]